MKNAFTLTYEIVTPESAEYGDAAERGFRDERGNRYAEPVAVPLRAALNTLGSMEPNDSECESARWWSEIDGAENYRTGAHEYRTLHLPDGITPASRARVNRLIKSR